MVTNTYTEAWSHTICKQLKQLIMDVNMDTEAKSPIAQDIWQIGTKQ